MVKQIVVDGFYSSEIINDRYQVLESEVLRGSFYIYDHGKDDILRARDGSCQYFDVLEDAMVVVTQVSPPKASRVKTCTNEPKPVKVKVDKPAGEPREPRKSLKGMIIELIKSGKTDEEVFELVKAEFPDREKFKLIDVKYQRKHLTV